mmetsp:Transcript_23790/g.59717  ORF Transcript_23790/g.59717 Transcript_23790/m.59717 type:complete len:207 (+) Transcript_23790:2434-3054(+)
MVLRRASMTTRMPALRFIRRRGRRARARRTTLAMPLSERMPVSSTHAKMRTKESMTFHPLLRYALCVRRRPCVKTLAKNSTVKSTVNMRFIQSMLLVGTRERADSNTRSSLGGASIRKMHETMMAANTIKSNHHRLPSHTKAWRTPFSLPKQPMTVSLSSSSSSWYTASRLTDILLTRSIWAFLTAPWSCRDAALPLLSLVERRNV